MFEEDCGTKRYVLFVSQFLPKSKEIIKIKGIKKNYLNAISDLKKGQNTQISKFQDSVV